MLSISSPLLLWINLFFLSLAVLEAAAAPDEVDLVPGDQTTMHTLRVVSDHLADYMRYPVEMTNRLVLFRQVGGFANDMAPMDRYQTLRFLHSEQGSMKTRGGTGQQQRQLQKSYYGMEDGSFLRISDDPIDPYIMYREPGESGYNIIVTTTNSTDDDVVRNSNSSGVVVVVVDPPEMEQFWKLCVSTNGKRRECQLTTGDLYINSSTNPADRVKPCQDNNTQKMVQACYYNTTTTNNSNNSNSAAYYSTSVSSSFACIFNNPQMKWCPQYTIEQVVDDILPTTTQLGYLPTRFMCMNQKGLPEQTPGKVLKNRFTGELGDCTYLDGITKVTTHDNNNIGSSFAYCENEQRQKQQSCNDTYVGAFADTSYDPRYRNWYTVTKQQQSAIWSSPYPFFHHFDQVGITYSQPIYNTDVEESNKLIFQGVVAFDYTLKQISEFLVERFGGISNNYNNNDNNNIHVLIVEEEEEEESPLESNHHYVIASSTGSPTSHFVLKEEPSQSCPYRGKQARDLCTVVRVTIDRLDEHPNDAILRGAFHAQREAGWPQEELVHIQNTHTDNNNKTNNHTSRKKKMKRQFYVSQSEIFSPHEDTNFNLLWRLIVATPVDHTVYDAALPGESTFAVICTIGTLGFVVCLGIFALFFSRRSEPEIRCADWRFTCAFLVGCTMFNLSTFTLLGELSDQICMLRMWPFNLLFAAALSPLFVKVFRMYRILDASSSFRRKRISHCQAALMTVPIVLAEVLLLLIFSLVDPPILGTQVDVSGGFVTQYILCEHGTDAFLVVQGTFHGLLVLAGCVLAYLTRNVDPLFGEAWQLAFAMYNIGFTAIIITTIVSVVETDPSGLLLVLQAMGTLWGTAFSASAFVLPRLSKGRASDSSMRSFVFRSSICSRPEATQEVNISSRVDVAQQLNKVMASAHDKQEEVSSVSSEESFHNS